MPHRPNNNNNILRTWVILVYCTWTQKMYNNNNIKIGKISVLLPSALESPCLPLWRTEKLIRFFSKRPIHSKNLHTITSLCTWRSVEMHWQNSLTTIVLAVLSTSLQLTLTHTHSVYSLHAYTCKRRQNLVLITEQPTNNRLIVTCLMFPGVTSILFFLRCNF